MNSPVLKFHDELIATGAFGCCKCQNILQPPTTFVTGVGNICAHCLKEVSKISDSTCWPNTALDAVLQRILFPCSFEHTGCPERLSICDLNPHTGVCRYRTTYCIFFPECKWNGQLSIYLRHLRDAHRDKIISQSRTFPIRYTDGNDVIIASVNNTFFIFKISVDTNSGKIWYKLYDLQNKASGYHICVKHIGRTDTELRTACSIVQELELLTFDKSDATVVDIALLKSVIQSDTFETILKIKSKMHEAELQTNSMIQHLECPVCKNFMKPPISQCISGHSVCGACKPQLDKCPTCRATFANTRNYALESLTYKFKYPCVYHEEGCTQVFTADIMASHDQTCSYKPYRCFFPECVFKGKFKLLADHIKEKHQKRAIFGDTHRTVMPFCGDKYIGKIKYAMLCCNAIFNVTYKQSLDSTFWAVDLHCTDCSSGSSELSTYIYEVCLYDAKKTHKKIIRTDTCLMGSPDGELFRKCIILPNNIVMSFSTKNTIRFHIKIREEIQASKSSVSE